MGGREFVWTAMFFQCHELNEINVVGYPLRSAKN